MENLTERERQILDLILSEYTTRQISDLLKISTRTVDSHRRRIIQKTGSKNLVGLIKLGLISRMLNKNNIHHEKN